MPASRQLPKNQLRIIARLGGHETKAEARRIEEAIRTHRPRVLILEDAAAEATTRLRKIQTLNEHIRSVRRGTMAKRRFMEVYVEQHSTREFEPFRRAQFEALLDARDLVAWVIEEHAPGFQQALEAHAKMRGELSVYFYNAIFDGELEEALAKNLEFEVEAERVMGRKDVILAGLERLPTELPQVFPELGDAGSLVAVASYGATHYPAFEELKRRGWDVEVELDPMVAADFGFRCLQAMIDEGLKMRPGNRARLFYVSLYEDMKARGVVLTDAQAEPMFQRLGGETGFLGTLNGIAGRCAGDRNRFVSELFGAFAAAARK